jgi:hypothetical protein
MAVKKKKAKKKPVGRPPFEATEKHHESAYKGAKKGLNEQEISKVMGIGYSTFKENKQLFLADIKKGREASQDERLKTVENSLLKNCEGYFVEETVMERRGTLDRNNQFTGDTNAVQRKTKKYIKPSDMAIFFFLVNRSNGKWESINRRDWSTENDSGEILNAIRKMKQDAQSRK